MQKEKRITLNADKRKVIADVFQDHFESNSKFKKAHQDAISTYNDMRKEAKVKTIGITTGTYSRKQLEAANADFILEDLKDTNKILTLIL